MFPGGFGWVDALVAPPEKDTVKSLAQRLSLTKVDLLRFTVEGFDTDCGSSKASKDVELRDLAGSDPEAILVSILRTLAGSVERKEQRQP